MLDAIQALMVLVGTCFAAMTVGASLTFGAACVCRWMAWAPINTTINIHNHGDQSSP